MELELFFPVDPVAVQSARFYRAGKFIRSYQPEKVTDYKQKLKLLAREQIPDNFDLLKTALGIETTFVFSAPKSFSKKKLDFLLQGGIIYKTTRPDLTDNLHKALLDSLTGIVWEDDSIIAVAQSRKIYGRAAGIYLNIYELKELS